MTFDSLSGKTVLWGSGITSTNPRNLLLAGKLMFLHSKVSSYSLWLEFGTELCVKSIGTNSVSAKSGKSYFLAVKFFTLVEPFKGI